MTLSGAPVALPGGEWARTYPVPRAASLVASVARPRGWTGTAVTEAGIAALAADAGTPARVRDWAIQTDRALHLRRARARERILLACGCADQGQYRAVVHPDYPDDTVVTAVTYQDDDGLYSWRPVEQSWQPVPEAQEPVGMPYLDLDEDMLAGLLESLQGEDSYLVVRAEPPLSRIPHGKVVVAALAPGPVFAVVDALDPGAVLDVISVQDGQIRRRKDSDWADAPELVAALRGVDPPRVVALEPGIVERVLQEVDQFDSLQKKEPGKGGPAPEAEPVAAAGATTAMDPDLVAYWTKGKGALKVKWGVPKDFSRCQRHLRKYLKPGQVDGACANLHKIALGVWPGQEKGKGHGVTAGAWSEEDHPRDAGRFTTKDGEEKARQRQKARSVAFYKEVEAAKRRGEVGQGKGGKGGKGKGAGKGRGGKGGGADAAYKAEGDRLGDVAEAQAIAKEAEDVASEERKAKSEAQFEADKEKVESAFMALVKGGMDPVAAEEKMASRLRDAEGARAVRTRNNKAADDARKLRYAKQRLALRRARYAHRIARPK